MKDDSAHAGARLLDAGPVRIRVEHAPGGSGAGGGTAEDLAEVMREVYADTAAVRRERLLGSAPVLLALFDGTGGRMLLHTPDGRVARAAPVPVVYQRLKGLAHAPVAVFELATSSAPAADPSAARFAEVAARTAEDPASLGLGPQETETGRALLALCEGLMARVRVGERPSRERVDAFARACAPLVLRLVERAAAVQVGHWTAVLDRWQRRLGGSFGEAYAAVNTLYVTRTKNVLFTVVAQYLGEAAIGERLFLFETPEFTTAPDRMLDLLGRVVADRELGRAFFGQGRVMDVEIMGDGARAAVREEMARRGRDAALPPTAPYATRQWPWATDPESGTGPSTLGHLLQPDHPDRTGRPD
ncbi:hypothetical protein [Streptomyces sp. NPDC094049]|uniref:hypothetical protein n=1 Tax=Streptomyces sp. NPDC094049 TaxID=3154987 RepID=UPI003334348B